MLKCYVSYKTENALYAYRVLGLVPGAFLKSPGSWAGCYDESRRLEDIREEILGGSDVTIHLIGACSAERLGYDEQRFIKRELSASLCKAKNGLRSGVLGVVLPEAGHSVLKTRLCPECGEVHERAVIDDSTAVSEYSRNYRCGCRSELGYCTLAPWQAFVACPNVYIERANARRFGPAAQTVEFPAVYDMPFSYERLKGDNDVQEG